MSKKKTKNNTPEPAVTPTKKLITVRSTFDRDMKKVSKYPEFKKNEELLKTYLDMLSRGEPLPRKADDHKLAKHSPGELAKCREFHLETDIVVIYRNDGETIELINIGKHSRTRLTNSLKF